MIRPVSLISTRREISLLTSFERPPIPVRHLDWSAIDDNTYDAEYVEGRWLQGPHGYGPTELSAIYHLFDQLEEE